MAGFREPVTFGNIYVIRQTTKLKTLPNIPCIWYIRSNPQKGFITTST